MNEKQIDVYGKTGNKDLDELIVKAKAIEQSMHIDIMKRYRECGQLILSYGYSHSWDARGIRKLFMASMGISRNVFEWMIQLGRMMDSEFANTVSIYPSLHRFVNKLPLTEDVKQYRKEHKKTPKEFYCEQGLPEFPHCCVMCQYCKKRVKIQ